MSENIVVVFQIIFSANTKEYIGNSWVYSSTKTEDLRILSWFTTFELSDDFEILGIIR